MARRAISMIAFPYIYVCVCVTCGVCNVYVVKEVASFQGAQSINGRGA